MTTTTVDYGRAAAVLLVVISAGIAAAMNAPALGLSTQVLAGLGIVQACISTLLLFLPRVQETAPPADPLPPAPPPAPPPPGPAR